MGHHLIYGKELADIRKKEAKKAADTAGIESLVLDIGDKNLRQILKTDKSLYAS
jgi:LmbE family N-acetylglucosaminyl deacetylase